MLSPFHSRLRTANREALHLIGHCEVQFGGQAVRVDLFDFRQGDVRWILFGADGYFSASGGMGGADPYFHDDPEKLLIDSLFASAAIPRVLENFRALAENRMKHTDSTPVLRKDGTVFHADISASHIEYEGRPCIIGFFRDVTLQRQIQQDLEHEPPRIAHI